MIGRPEVIDQRIARLGLRIRAGKDFELVNPDSDPRYREYWTLYHRLTERKGVSVEDAKTEVRRRTTLIAALLVRQGEADAMICGTYGQHKKHLRYIKDIIGLKAGANNFAAMNTLLHSKGQYLSATLT